MNLYEAALTILAAIDPPDPNAPSRVAVHVQSSSFEGNERGFSLGGFLASAAVTDCTFAGNAAMHAGAGLLVYVDPLNPPVNVTGCHFVDNAAGFVNIDAFAAYANSFRLHDDEVCGVQDIACM